MGSRNARVEWPVRSGAVPALENGLSARSKTAADLGAALVAGGTLVLVPVRVAGERPGSWLESCGKTQLAVYVAELLWRLRKIELLVWIVATSRASVVASYFQAAVDVMDADAAGDGDAEAIAARFVRWLGKTDRPWLIVLDDLRDVADLQGLCPAGPAGRIVITTANPAAIPAEQGRLIEPVGLLSADEALGYLTGRLAADSGKLGGAPELAHAVGYEPLALGQAGAVIANSALSCRDYLDRYERRRAQVAEAVGGEPPAAAVTWAISAEYAAALAPDGAAQRLLSLAALFDGHGFPATIFATRSARGYLAEQSETTAAAEERASAPLRAAERAGLISVTAAADGAVPMVRMSAVVQAAARVALLAGAAPDATVAAADSLLQAWPDDERPIWLAAAMRSSVASLRGATGDNLWANGCHPVMLRAGRSLDRARLAGCAVAYWSELAAASDRILGPGHPDSLTISERLVAAFLAAGRAKEGVARAEGILAERVRVLGPDHPTAIAARRDLGHALVAAGRHDAATAALTRVIADSSRVRGAVHLETLEARDELTAAYRAAGQFADAIVQGSRTLADRERVQGSEHPAARVTRQRLAAAYLADGRYKDAIAHYKRVLADSARELGSDHPDTIAARASLGAANHAAGRTASAIQLCEQTLADYERVLGADDPATLASGASLADVYYTAGRLTDAVTLLRDTLARCERALPAGDPLTASVHQALAGLTGG